MSETPESGQMTEEVAQEWAVIELMGHRRLAGRISPKTYAGREFVRLDIPGPDGKMQTQLYSPDAVYCITPTTEEIARCVAAQTREHERPVSRWEIQDLLPEKAERPVGAGEEDYDDEWDKP